MAVDRCKVAVFGAAFVLRLLLVCLFPSLPDLLTGRVEVSTPVNSFKRLQEGLFLYIRNVSPYDGGVFHQAPLLLPLFALLPDVQSSPFPTAIFYFLVDLVNAHALITISESGQSVQTRLHSAMRKHIRWDGVSIAAWFLFNPFTIATCLARSTSVFTTTGILYAVSNAVDGNSVNAILALGFASYLSLYPALLFVPLALLCYDQQTQSAKAPGAVVFFVQHGSILLASVAGLLGLSYLVTGNFWEFMSATYGFHLLVPDLTPNVGLWWYFFIEMFDSFREFFLGVFWLHLASYVGASLLVCGDSPYSLLPRSWASLQSSSRTPAFPMHLSTLRCYLCTATFSLVMMRYTFFAVSALLYSSLLGPAFYHLWIYAGSGNANFFYAITLVWSLGLSILLADSIFAALRDEWEQANPELQGQEVKQI
ncbi:hypothetical protein N7454_000739 [Penicillium verhagenii]|nr:hypothetical protein N7454_000739 [Penicillium verhagenii]